jgi:hypothetical protein
MFYSLCFLLFLKFLEFILVVAFIFGTVFFFCTLRIDLLHFLCVRDGQAEEM